MADEDLISHIIQNQFFIERLRHRFGCYVVMSGADSAGGEHIIHLTFQIMDGRNDFRFHIRHHAHLMQRQPHFIHLFGDPGGIGILRPAGQDFIPDDDQGDAIDVFVAVQGHFLFYKVRNGLYGYIGSAIRKQDIKI